LKFKNYLFFCFIVVNTYGTSLRDTVEYTLNENPDIISEHMKDRAYQKYVDQEESDYKPKLDLEGFLERSKTFNNYDDNTPDNNGIKDGSNVVLKFEHILYDGGLTPSQAQEYRYKYFGNKFTGSLKKEQIIQDVVKAYIDLVSRQELVALSQNNIKTHEQYLVIAKDKEKISGEVLETHQVNSKYHFVLDRFLEQQNQNDTALSLYKKLTTRELEGNICRPIIYEEFIPITMKEAIELGIRRSPKIQEQIQKINEQREKVVQAEANFKPTLKFQLQGQWDNDLELPENGEQDIYRARIYMSWNLYDGKKTHHMSEKEKLFLKSEQKILDAITLEVVDKIKESYRTYYNNKKRIENIRLFVQDNENILKIYQKQLEDGTRTFLDILNAESELYRSQINQIEQEFDLMKSYYDLMFNMSFLSDSILMSKNQICSKYEYKPKIQEEKKATPTDGLSDELLDIFKEDTKGEIHTIENKAIIKKPIEKKEEAPLVASTMEKGNTVQNNGSENDKLHNLQENTTPDTLTKLETVKNDDGETENTIDVSQRIRELYANNSTTKRATPLGKIKKISVEENKPKENQESSPTVNSDIQKVTTSQRYTINVATLKTKGEALEFIAKYGLDSKEVQWYSFGSNGENIKIIYGSFSSINEAKGSLKLFDAKQIKGIYVDNLQKHTNLKQKYREFNKGDEYGK
jgi:outer membrane protein, adhesin transport system